MINPGVESNPVYPTASGQGGKPNMGNWYGQQLLSVDGFTLTMGMVLVGILAILLWQTFGTRRRR